jgi:hypothetical protein
VDVTPPTPAPGEECIPLDRYLSTDWEDDEEDEEEDSSTTDEEDMLDEHEKWDEEEVVERDPFDYPPPCWGC